MERAILTGYLRPYDVWRDTPAMRRNFTATVVSGGAIHTQLAIQDELGWLFREQLPRATGPTDSKHSVIP